MKREQGERTIDNSSNTKSADEKTMMHGGSNLKRREQKY